MQEVLGALLEQPIEVTENGEVKHLPGMEVLLRRTFTDALRSESPAAKKFLITLAERYTVCNDDEPAHNAREVLAEDEAILARYLTSKNEPVAVGSEISAS